MTQLSGSFGNVINLAPSAAVSKGEFVVVGKISGIAADNLKANEKGPVILHGVVKLEPRNAATTFNVGQKCYSSNSSNKINNSAANGLTKFVGYALETSANNSSAAIDVLLSTEGEDT